MNCIGLIKSDLYRYGGDTSFKAFLKNYLQNPGFRYLFYLRLTHYFSTTRLKPVYIIFALILRHLKFKFGFEISHKTKIGKGMYLGHFGSGIIVNHQAVIGDNCVLSHGITIGVTKRGANAGVPVIGNNVFIGPGAQIIGNIHIADNAAIGANCVVTKDVPANAVVVGVPGKIISYAGSGSYTAFTEESSQPEFLQKI